MAGRNAPYWAPTIYAPCDLSAVLWGGTEADSAQIGEFWAQLTSLGSSQFEFEGQALGDVFQAREDHCQSVVVLGTNWPG